MSAEEKPQRPRRTDSYAGRMMRDSASGRFIEATFAKSKPRSTVRETTPLTAANTPMSAEATQRIIDSYIESQRVAKPAQHADDDQVRNATERLLKKRMGLMMILAER